MLVEEPVNPSDVRRSSCTASMRFYFEFRHHVRSGQLQIGQQLSGHTAETRVLNYVDPVALCISAFEDLRQVQKNVTTLKKKFVLPNTTVILTEIIHTFFR